MFCFAVSQRLLSSGLLEHSILFYAWKFVDRGDIRWRCVGGVSRSVWTYRRACQIAEKLCRLHGVQRLDFVRHDMPVNRASLAAVVLTP